MAQDEKTLEDILAFSIVEWSIHVNITCANLSKENQALKQALTTRPVLPDPAVIYAEKITE